MEAINYSKQYPDNESIYREFTALCEHGSLEKLIILWKLTELNLDEYMLYWNHEAFSKAFEFNREIAVWLLEHCSGETKSLLFRQYILPDTLHVSMFILDHIDQGDKEQCIMDAFPNMCALGDIKFIDKLSSSDEFKQKLYLPKNAHPGFVKACEYGHYDLVLKILRESYGVTPIQTSKKKYIEIIDALGIRLIHMNDGEAFIAACANGHLDIAKHLFSRCAEWPEYDDHLLSMGNYRAFRKAYRYLNILEWIWSVRPRNPIMNDNGWITLGTYQTRYAVDLLAVGNYYIFRHATQYGCLDVMKWCVKKAGNTVKMITADNHYALRHCSLICLEYLLSLYTQHNITQPERIMMRYRTNESNGRSLSAFRFPWYTWTKKYQIASPEKISKPKARIGQPRKHN